MLCTHKAAGSNPVFSRVWDEAAVACQFHALNVEGSNPSPTGNSSSGGMVDTVDLKFTPLAGVSVQLRGWVAGMVELEDTVDLGSIGLGCASSTLVTCIPFFL